MMSSIDPNMTGYARHSCQFPAKNLEVTRKLLIFTKGAIKVKVVDPDILLAKDLADF